MNTLYWISVLGSLNDFSSIFAVIIGTVTIGFIIAFLINKFCDNMDETKIYGKLSGITLCLFLINVIIAIFVPTKNELYVIYGVGNTIDYLRNNPTASQLPDKTIKMLDLMADEFIDKHTNDSDTTKTN